MQIGRLKLNAKWILHHHHLHVGVSLPEGTLSVRYGNLMISVDFEKRVLKKELMKSTGTLQADIKTFITVLKTNFARHLQMVLMYVNVISHNKPHFAPAFAYPLLTLFD